MKIPRRHPHGSVRRLGTALLAVTVALAPTVSSAAPAAPAPAAPPTAPATSPAPSPAPAVSGGPDEVVLKNGGFVRGTVVELLPNEHVVIVPDGATERRTIPWADVERVDRGKHAAVRAPEPTPAPAPEPAPALPIADPEPTGTRVMIQTSNEREVTLHEVESELYASGYYTSVRGMSWKNVCVAPCNRYVDGSRGQDFFLTTKGSLITASRRFKLTGNEREVMLDVRPGNGPMRVIGVVLASMGAGLLVGGALLVALDSTRKFGIGMLAVGAPSLVVGIPLTILGRTRLEKR